MNLYAHDIYRLTNDQIKYYSELFNAHATDKKVNKEKFLPLLGIFGTQIAQDFSSRIFEILSNGANEITLDKYLQYMDIYHYGDIEQRCRYMYRLIDIKNKGKVEMEDFKSYIYLIINTVKKVNNAYNKDDLMSEKDIEILFYHISKGKNYFSYDDLENIYKEKPELVSWFDYFKNDKEDIFLIIHENIQSMLSIFNEFVSNFMNDLFLSLDKGKQINLELLFENVKKYSAKMDKNMNIFIKKISKFNISSALYHLQNKDYDKNNLINDLQHNYYESKFDFGINKSIIDVQYENVNDYFKEIKNNIYQKDQPKYAIQYNNINIQTNVLNEALIRRSDKFQCRDFIFCTKSPQLVNYNIYKEYTPVKLYKQYDMGYNNYNYNMQNNFTIKESQKMKQLLFCSRVIIEKASQINLMIKNCYKWISDNYFSKEISKKKREEKLKPINYFKRKSSKINVPKKMAPLHKNIIGASDKSFEILFNIIMGIQIAVQSTPNFRIDNRNEIKKYLTKMLYSIQSIYLGKKKDESYLLKEFGGVVFNNIRMFLGINKDNFIKSISPQDFITEIMISSQTIFEELCSTGRSGSLLYYTRDAKFMVKTISRKEYKFLKTILEEYFFYIKENPLSFLPKLLGCYVLQKKVKKKVTNIYFTVMNNVFSTFKHIDLRFDLKGSTIGRRVLKGTPQDVDILSSGGMALKDLDFNKYVKKIYLGEKRDKILAQIKKDIEFLYYMNSNDYSLLLGIHNIKDNNIKRNTIKSTELNFSFASNDNINDSVESESNSFSEESIIDRINKSKELYDFDDQGILSANKKQIYYFGIIDVLTEFNTKKQFEFIFKQMRYCSENMSCIPPIYIKIDFSNI